jgi:hypothetical protein
MDQEMYLRDNEEKYLSIEYLDRPIPLDLKAFGHHNEDIHPS